MKNKRSVVPYYDVHYFSIVLAKPSVKHSGVNLLIRVQPKEKNRGIFLAPFFYLCDKQGIAIGF